MIAFDKTGTLLRENLAWSAFDGGEFAGIGATNFYA